MIDVMDEAGREARDSTTRASIFDGVPCSSWHEPRRPLSLLSILCLGGYRLLMPCGPIIASPTTTSAFSDLVPTTDYQRRQDEDRNETGLLLYANINSKRERLSSSHGSRHGDQSHSTSTRTETQGRQLWSPSDRDMLSNADERIVKVLDLPGDKLCGLDDMKSSDPRRTGIRSDRSEIR